MIWALLAVSIVMFLIGTASGAYITFRRLPRTLSVMSSQQWAAFVERVNEEDRRGTTR